MCCRYTMRTDRYRYTEWVAWNGTTLSPIWSKLKAAELYDHLEDTGCGNLDIILDHLSCTSQLYITPTRAVRYALLRAHPDRALIRAWNPMLWLIWGFRAWTNADKFENVNLVTTTDKRVVAALSRQLHLAFGFPDDEA